MVSSKTAASLIAVALFTAGGALYVGSALAAPEGASAEAILRTLEADRDDAERTTETRKRARIALERATRFRETGDETRARLAEGLALRTAELARDQARTLRIEKNTDLALRAAQDAGAQVDRERALVEEALAQGGRLRAQLEALAAEKKREPERTATRVLADAGVAPAKTPPRAARDGGAP